MVIIMPNKKRLTVYLDPKIYEYVRKEAFKLYVTKSKFVEERLLPEISFKKWYNKGFQKFLTNQPTKILKKLLKKKRTDLKKMEQQIEELEIEIKKRNKKQ